MFEENATNSSRDNRDLTSNVIGASERQAQEQDFPIMSTEAGR
jgi:hypothetical protein